MTRESSREIYVSRTIVFFIAGLISIAGLVTMSGLSFSDPYFIKQSFWIILSITLAFLLSKLDFRFLNSTKPVSILYGVSLFFLALIFILGKTSKGALSWFSVGGISFQPVDMVKLVLSLVLAKYFSRRHIEIAYLKHIVLSFLYLFFPLFLVLLQPDFGSGMVLCAIWFAIVVIAGMTKKHLLVVFTCAVAVFVSAWLFLFKPYQKARIMNFIHPLADIRGSGYNAYQSTIAVGSGKVFGKGIGYGTQSRLEYLPEYRTDFIFAAYAEEWGFVGSIFLLSLFLTLFLRLLSFARFAYSNFEALFTYGVVAWFFTHTVVSVGMNIGIMPVTGIPLPFMSYGGTHLLIEYIALGMCVGMSRYGRSYSRDPLHHEGDL